MSHQWHLEDYTSPLSAYPICRRCHYAVHIRFRRPDYWQRFLRELGTKTWVHGECGCPEETWDTPYGSLNMHLTGKGESNAHLDAGDGGEWSKELIFPTIAEARAAFFGWAMGLHHVPSTLAPAIGASSIPVGAGERIKAYIAELLNVIQPFASAAEHADAVNAARDPAEGTRVYPWNYVNPTHFADAFAIFSDRLDPDDWAILDATPAVDAIAADAPECAKSCGDPRWCTEAKACWRTNEWRDGAIRARAPDVDTQTLAQRFRDASRGLGRAGTAEWPGGPYMSMGDAAAVYADLMQGGTGRGVVADDAVPAGEVGQ